MKTILFTNARNEDNILEWVIHHLHLGFDFIYIFDHISKTPIKEVLQKFNHPLVYVETLYGEIFHKNQTISNSIDFSVMHGFDWMIYLDADEFLVLNHDETVSDFLEKYNTYQQVSLNWLLFGSNHIDQFNGGTIIENYTKCEPTLSKTIKTFLNLNNIKKHENFSINNPHILYLDNYDLSVGVDFKTVNKDCPFSYEPAFSIQETPAFIAHYVHQSYDTYIKRKISIPRDDGAEFRNVIEKEEFHKMHNDIEYKGVLEKYNQRNKSVFEIYK